MIAIAASTRALRSADLLAGISLTRPVNSWAEIDSRSPHRSWNSAPDNPFGTTSSVLSPPSPSADSTLAGVNYRPASTDIPDQAPRSTLSQSDRSAAEQDPVPVTNARGTSRTPSRCWSMPMSCTRSRPTDPWAGRPPAARTCIRRRSDTPCPSPSDRPDLVLAAGLSGRYSYYQSPGRYWLGTLARSLPWLQLPLPPHPPQPPLSPFRRRNDRG